MEVRQRDGADARGKSVIAGHAFSDEVEDRAGTAPDGLHLRAESGCIHRIQDAKNVGEAVIFVGRRRGAEVLQGNLVSVDTHVIHCHLRVLRRDACPALTRVGARARQRRRADCAAFRTNTLLPGGTLIARLFQDGSGASRGGHGRKSLVQDIVTLIGANAVHVSLREIIASLAVLLFHQV